MVLHNLAMVGNVIQIQPATHVTLVDQFVPVERRLPQVITPSQLLEGEHSDSQSAPVSKGEEKSEDEHKGEEGNSEEQEEEGKSEEPEKRKKGEVRSWR